MKGLKKLMMFSGQSCRLAVKVSDWKPTETEWIHAAQCVKTDEKQRIGQFYFKRDAKSTMAGRLLLRYAVAKILNVPTRTLLFDRTEHGKPVLLSPVDRSSRRTDLSFNVSHQGDYVLLAAERGGRSVGVDVMKVEWTRNTPVSSFFKTMEKQFTPSEWSAIKNGGGDLDQLKVFFRLWTLKECVVKALGLGIGFGVSRLNFVFNTPDVNDGTVCCDTQVEIDGELKSEWHFEESFIDGHCMAVGLTQPTTSTDTKDATEPALSFNVIDMQQVLEGCDPLTGNTPDPTYWEAFNNKQDAPS